MRLVQYRRWSPPKSPVRVEFTAEVLNDVRTETQQDHDRGFLYGLRLGCEVRVLAARRAASDDDPRLAGLTIVGIYVSRVRGEVFLTDADIEFMDRHHVTMALVVVGAYAGFFAREVDGTLQAVRSYEEFSVLDAVAKTEVPAPRAAEPERPVRHPGLAPRNPAQSMLLSLVLLIGPAAALAYLRPLLPQPPLELQLRESSGQLLIAWNPQAVEHGGRLEIVDHGDRTRLPITAGTASATYSIRGGDVEVRLVSDTRTGTARWTGARFVSSTASSGDPEAMAKVQRQMTALEREARTLRQSIAAGAARINELKRRANEIIGTPLESAATPPATR